MSYSDLRPQTVEDEPKVLVKFTVLPAIGVPPAVAVSLADSVTGSLKSPIVAPVYVSVVAGATFTETGSEGMPLVTTTKLAAPRAKPVGTSKNVLVTLLSPTAS